MRRLADDIWTERTSHKFFGVDLGARTTIVRLEDGGLWVHSPIPLDEERKAEIDALGDVRHIVAPNRFHHVYVDQWVEAYPDADLWGAPGLPEKRTDLTFNHVLTKSTPPWEGRLDQRLFEGSETFNEVVFFHRASRTLIGADLFLNIREPANVATKMYCWTNGVLGKPGLSWVIWFALDDRETARRAYEQLLDWEFERIVVAHGAVVEDEARAVLRQIIDESF